MAGPITGRSYRYLSARSPSGPPTRHQDALGLLDLRPVGGDIGDRGVDGLITGEVAEADVDAFAADDGVGVATQLLTDDENAARPACGVDDPVPAVERLALPRHRLDQQRDLRRVVWVFMGDHQRRRGLNGTEFVAVHMGDGVKPLPPVLGAEVPEQADRAPELRCPHSLQRLDASSAPRIFAPVD
jgi:hypothetical protein